MTKAKNLAAGLGGAIALNILHESLKKTDGDMPRVDLLGEEAIQKTLHFFGTGINDEETLYKAALAGDVISNTLYYSVIGKGDPQHIWPRAIAYGLAAGVGAITLPEPMGLDEETVTRTPKTKALTVAYYVVGALVTGAILKAFAAKEK